MIHGNRNPCGPASTHYSMLPAFLFFAIAAAFLAISISGCATPPEGDAAAIEAQKQANDPIERVNRGIFAVNRGLDKAILKPLAFAYREVVPQPGRDGVRNVLDNLRGPIILDNDLLQGEIDRAATTFWRFIVNSTFGLLGLFDVATEMGLARHDEDFGQTLAVWGVGDGPYIMLPLFGPSNPRDTVGLIVDVFLDPFNIVARNEDAEYLSYTRFGLRAVDNRARRYDTLNDLERTSLDFYASIRSLYRQRRDDEIRNGVPSANVPAPTMSRLRESFPTKSANTAR